MENYLEAIYELSGDGRGARVSDIAKRLGVTKASTNSAVSTLAEKGLVVNEPYREVYLTREGFALAQATAQKHQTILSFFTQVLHIRPVTADVDACAIEHVISAESVSAMQQYLNGIKAD